MMDSGGFDIRNLLQPHTMAVWLFFVGALVLLGILSVSFRGSVVA